MLKSTTQAEHVLWEVCFTAKLPGNFGGFVAGQPGPLGVPWGSIFTERYGRAANGLTSVLIRIAVFESANLPWADRQMADSEDSGRYKKIKAIQL